MYYMCIGKWGVARAKKYGFKCLGPCRNVIGGYTNYVMVGNATSKAKWQTWLTKARKRQTKQHPH